MKNTGATTYLLDLRVINATDIAPVVITLTGSNTERLIQGLRPGTTYNVTVKMFQFYYVMCSDTQAATTGPATAQITSLKTLSSTSIQVEWTRVTTAESYYLLVESETGRVSLNFTYTNTSTVVQNLQPSTAYSCSIYTANKAGLGDRSSVRTITTLVQPPKGVTGVQIGKRTARVSWQPVEKVILYKVTVTYLDEPNRAPFKTNASNSQLEIQDILPCSSYQISVASFNTFLQPGEPTEYLYTTNRLSNVVSISVDYFCSGGSATVSWAPVLGADSYRAVATSSDGTVLSCTSQTTECQIIGSGCGKDYLVKVTAVSDGCEATANVTSHFVTVPCPPKEPQLFRECSSNVIVFSWAATNHTDFYTATAVDSQGEVMTCVTEDTSCFFTDTACGRLYNFTVYSVSSGCNSQDSPAVTVRTAPCMPQNMISLADCQSNILTITWDSSEGAVFYVVEAWGNNDFTKRYNCSSFNNSCAIPSVHCGESLAMYITAFDNDCPSSMTLGQVAVTVPCVPQNLSAVMLCQDNSVTLNWEVTYGTLFYIATVTDDTGVLHTCNSMNTECQITGLRCSSTYTAFVTASNLICNSSHSDTIYIETVPCPTDHVHAFLDCAANQALIVWQGYSSRLSYTAIMEDTEGGLLSCSTTGNNCTIPSLKCGQLYSVSVTHHDGICPSIRSNTINMESVPCGPANVNTKVDCGSGTLMVSWSASLHVEQYTTIITRSNGEQVFFNSMATNCNVTTLDCGEEYSVTVRSVNGSCLSMPSQDMVISQVPCIPTNIMAKHTCGENSTSVTWDASRGAKMYTAIAVSDGGHHTACTSNSTACGLTDLLCGQTYSLSVIAADDNCSSMKSNTVILKTVPCPPTNVSGWVDCSTNTASLSWDASPNAVSYFGTAVGTNGQHVSCKASALGCQLTALICGQVYIFTVSASYGRCESPESQQVTLETAPCVPQNVVNSLFCDNNTLSVSWAPASIDRNYSATARAVNGTSGSCTTMGSTCMLDGLPCGQQYTITVSFTSSNCSGPSSRPQTVQTVPCVPLHVRGHVDCASNTLQASWDATDGAHSYISMINGSDGYNSTRVTAALTSSFTGLECAKMYSLSVVAKDYQCNSFVSAYVSVITAPCNPKNVAALLQCSSGVVTVSWEASAGAATYTAFVQRDGGTNVTQCKTTGTSCDLTQLECGEVYNVTVVAGDGTCNSTLLATTTVKTAPCPPTMNNPSLDCASNQASISWAKDDQAVSFFINGSSALGHTSSCSSTNTSCLLDHLLCGQTYTVHAIAQGDKCNSVRSESFEIVTAPCTPANLHVQYECGTSIALLSWDETLGRDSFVARVYSSDHSDSCSTTDTYCSLTTLMCGHWYNVTVDAVAGHCNSSQSAVTQFQTASCAPQNVSARLVCSNSGLAVTWQASPGPVAYNVIAQGNDGDNRKCITNNTSCDLPNMHCGQTYEITVTPFSETCKGFDSAAFTFNAGPCPPIEVWTALQCEDNIGSVSWVAARTAEMYIATATDQNGHAYNCSTSGTTSCSFGGLQCGKTYAVSVLTMDRGCLSEPSPPVTLKSAICPPTNLAGVTACGTNDLTLTWDPSPKTGVTYVLYSQRKGGANTSYSTADTSHVISGLQCGEHYSFRITAQDSVCTSSLSSTMEIHTAPCHPTNLTAQANCGTNTGTLTWNLSAGGETYIVTVTGTTHSHTTSCTSQSTSCSVQLDCGYPYLATVVASSGTCNSTTNTVQFDSAPCLPGNVTAVLDCSANTFAVKWSKSQGKPKSYMALAIGSDGSHLTCNTSSTACIVHGLTCGVTYSIAVTTTSINCSSIEGSDYKVQSAPCTPEGPAVSLDCRTNIAEVTWDNTGPDQINMVSAVDWLGKTTSCNSTGSNCTFGSLTCGQAYTLTVQGLSNTCQSAPSTSVNLFTAPCVPNHVVASVDCDTGITSVTWDLARGANSYTVYAEGSGGHNTTCVGSDTNCAFYDLMCGQDYAMVVLAKGDSCVSLASESITTTTAPCPHTGLQASLNCSTNTALISWTPGNGILTYNVSAEGFDITHYLTCSTSGSSCSISQLLCGQRYRVSISGEGRTCPSITNDWVTINTAPCPPTALSVQTSCSSNNISVNWTASHGSVSYTAVAQSIGGHELSCDTSFTACDILGLLCGQVYMVFVAGVDQNCVGTQSNVQVVHTAPCVPANVHNHLDCLSGVLTVTWQQRGNAPNFYSTRVTSEHGVLTECQTNLTTCVVPSIQCGLTYSVVVDAQSDACKSSFSPTQHVTAAPCPPDTVIAVVDCATNIVTVNWDNSVAGVLYTVTAKGIGGQHFTCNTEDVGCDLRNLSCGVEYNVTVTPSKDDCVGVSTPSVLVKTAPCSPHLVEVEMDCLSDSAWVIWDKSAGAEFYIATATGGQGHTSQCNATDANICAVPHLPCGERFTFTLTASDTQCSSLSVNHVVSETAPCPPQDVQTKAGCENNTVSVSWTPSVGALAYRAILERTDGEVTCCTTRGTGCDITQLPCGEMYVLTVTAEGRHCNSSQSLGDIVRTVPCTPQSLQASVNCVSNVATMTWNNSAGGQLYSVTATGTDGHVARCTSYESRCNLAGLHCGQHYTATVVAEDINCSSPVSGAAELKTVPCVPAGVSTVTDCDANAVSVLWSESLGADSYTATLRDSNGRTTSCQALSGPASCNVTGLGCGQLYHVTVAASDGYCSSPSTNVTDTYTAPCAPHNIMAEMDCEVHVGLVLWSMSPGAVSYVVTAATQSGRAVTCRTDNTFCELGDLACGESYSVSVLAQGESCSSQATMPGQLVTGPCVPAHLSTEYSITIGQVTWEASQGANLYTAEAVTDEGQTITCNTTDTFCPLYNMACSQEYNVTVTAHNNVCQHLATSESVSLKTEPCPPNNVRTSLDCETGRGTVSWEMSKGALGYMVSLEGRDGDSLSCHTVAPQTSCSMVGLNCGTVYYASVKVMGETLNSTDSTTVLLASAPCVSTNVQAVVDCVNASAMVTWDWSDGAQSYILTAIGSDGHQVTCHTEDNFCIVTELSCGQVYNLTLTTVDQNCQMETPTGVSFSTRPCAPLHVGVDLLCGTHAATLSWVQSEGVTFYMASANARPGGPTRYCNSTGTSCQFPALDCGETYSFTVMAHSSLCQSPLSSTVQIQTEPCQPNQVTATGSCDSETVVVAWTHAQGSEKYVVTAMGNLGYITEFQTNDTSLAVDLPCGQTYSLSVKGQDELCDSSSTNSAEFRTAPCMPWNVESYTNCENSLGSVSWAESDGAEYYTAVAIGSRGDTHMRVTNTTNCTWEDLHCGDLYTIHIISNDYRCSSSPYNSTTVRTAPCVPQNLVPSLDCGMRVGSLTWNMSHAADFYIVTAESNAGHKVEVSTNDTKTYFSEFQCGQEYFLSVQAVDSMCTSAPSQPATIWTEPCAPASVSSAMDCLSNIAVVKWLAAKGGAQYYTATAEHESGLLETCLSSTFNCSTPTLLCGQNYSITVTASNEQCHSDPSVVHVLTTVPCVPTGVVAVMNCSDNTAAVTWSPSLGALSYRAIAQSPNGVLSSCESHDPWCVLSNLTCGVSYDVQVVAVDKSCSSHPSRKAEFQTVPCTPAIAGFLLDCHKDSGLLQWASAAGAQSYNATARSGDGQAVTCLTNHTDCNLTPLACGQTYAVTVRASNGRCDSFQSAIRVVGSVPCSPQGVEYQLNCSGDSALVAWQASLGADSYSVQAMNLEGNVTGCQTNRNSCSVSGLICGTTYNLSVVAISNGCNTSQSATVQLKTVPCVPNNVQASLQCPSNSAAVVWEESGGALWYQAVGTTDGGHQVMCDSGQTRCDLSGLLCGQTYNVTVASAGYTCVSAGSDVVRVKTAPCPPLDVAVDVRCANGSAAVTWSADPDVDSFHVKAVTSGAANLSCVSVATGCSVSNLLCGHSYTFTVTSLRGGCESSSSAAVTVSPAPCAPQNAQGSLDCVSNSAWVSWDASGGATGYTVIADSGRGTNSTCNSPDTACNVPSLACGTNYTIHVTATNTFCQSAPSKTFNIETSPCGLTNVTMVTTCHSSSILVSWGKTQSSQLYVATAEGQDQSILTCNSTSFICELTGARCGMHYIVIVSASSDKCSSLRSPPQKISTAPCVPKDVKVVASCEAEGVVVSWDHSAVAQSYLLTATGRDGDIRTCNSSVNNCTLAQLHCGQPYTVSVTAGAEGCTSQASTNVTFTTVPCEPTGLSVEVQCETNTAVLSWAPSQGSVRYYGFAKSGQGYALHCDSLDTSCSIGGLACGVTYNFSVLASDGVCNSSSLLQKHILKGAAPCAPANVHNRMQLINKTHYARTSWTAVPCPDVEYLVEITGCILADPLAMFQISSYWTEYTYFELALPCGSSFNLTVRARNFAGTSEPFTPVTGITAPCAPLSVTYTGNNASAAISWEASMFATKYTVYDVIGHYRTEVCSTPELSCQLLNIQPGTIEVTASNAAGESVPNTYIIGPSNRHRRDLGLAEAAMFADLHMREELSKPEVLVATATGVSLHVEWAPVRDANLYTVILVQDDSPSRRQVSTISGELIDWNNLKPSTRYCIFVSAKNERTQSIYTNVCVTTGVSM
ncbi:uncharacterized protein LOC105029012 isoform X2 [Esox lucius]|uniref:Fibronectin type-III domain-containing protein n=2 Tax=Esox lucius TaxID=8010 RepID=A0A3P9AMG9_ESOLU|nr:uncharacterized protein LOC105029012 isoform X2 [Esox lucius]